MAERYLRSVYCEDAFLQKLAVYFDNYTFDRNITVFRLWDNIRSLLFYGDVTIYLDLDKDIFINRTEEIYKKRKKAAIKNLPSQLNEYEKILNQLELGRTAGTVRLHFDKPFKDVDFSVANSQRLNAIYLTCESKELCKSAEERYGVLAICPENVATLKKTLNDNGVSILNKDEGGWKSFLPGKPLPCNSTIIVDNYLLVRKETIDNNLGEILDSFLPQSLDIPFHITIVSSLKDNGYDCDGKDRYSKVKTLLETIRPNLTFKLLLCKEGELFHDRTIITNTTYITSGAGFADLYKANQSTHDTTVSILFPYITNHVKWLNKSYSTIIGRVKRFVQKTDDFKRDSCPFQLGDNRFRLGEFND